jgi:ABC transport system ATP-binding/permease protein
VAPRSLINLENVSLNYGKGAVLDEVSLGLAEGARIGVVGRNGGGKSSLIRILSGQETPNSGRVSVSGGTHLGTLAQIDQADPNKTVREIVMGDQADHEWASNARAREVLNGLFGGFSEEILSRKMGPLSGGERRRVALARLLIIDLDVLLLDEPTNHLDVEAVSWLATHLKSRRGLALIVVTHDRWFLDEVSEKTWEVIDGKVEEYEGGYSAFVLAKAERMRQSSVEEQKRNMLIKKELAWLRRGAPARTSKPKFRIDAANELIENEPPPRNNVELLAFANARLGKTVYELHNATIRIGERDLFKHLDWNIGPGDRIGIAGVNGAGKTTLLKTLTSQLKVNAGKLVTGTTVKAAFLDQHLEELNPKWRVLEAIENIATHVEIGKGKSLSASQLGERLGFGSDAQWTPVGDLSGGERRRLQLTRLLMGGPNVLILDEPTNDFDVETLAALEDLLDSFAGTLLVVSHDRYFLERVCDTFVGVMGDGGLQGLPGGLEQYLELRARQSADPTAFTPVGSSTGSNNPQLTAAQKRELQKDQQRIERSISKLDTQIKSLLSDMETYSSDFEKVAKLNDELQPMIQEKETLEERWMEISDSLE